MDKHFINTETPVPATLQQSTRIEALDVLRGFALLGVFLMNIEYFNRSLLEFGQVISSDVIGLDYMVAKATEIFIAGKFWVLFSMLFGMGFVLMQNQATRDKHSFEKFYLRRTAALLLFGLLHVLLLWPGDILHSYALAAFLLMCLPVISPRALFCYGCLIYLAPAFLVLLSGTLFGLMANEELNAKSAEAESVARQIQQAVSIYSNGDYWQVMQQRWQDFIKLLDYEIYVLISALGIFMVGAGIMRSGYLLDLQKNRQIFFKAMIFFGTLAAFFIVFAQSLPDVGDDLEDTSLKQGLMLIGNLPLSFFYFSAVIYTMSIARGRKILNLLAPAGKMALTNYLMQSFIASTVFFGYGLGLWNQWGRADLALFVIAVFIAQVIFSHLWLRYFRYGPMEWLWRALTYWTLPPMRIDAKHAVN